MSDEIKPDGIKSPLGSGPRKSGPRRERSLGAKLALGLAWLVGAFAVLLVLAFFGAAYYTRTADFQRRVGQELVTTLEDAIGGKAEVGGVHFDFWHLAVEIDGLVIHGLEGPGEAPYLTADKILVRLKIFSFLSHVSGTGIASHIGLNLLRVEQPHVHLIIDKQGNTNQPVPKKKSQSNEPVMDTLLDLKAQDVELVQGLAQVNDRAVPFNLAARDLNAQVNYLPETDRYGATVDLRDLVTQIAKQPEAKSSLHLEAEVGRDIALLKAFDFRSGEHSELTASGGLNHFANPEWQGKVAGSLDLKQVQVLGGVDGLDAGSVDLDLGGHNCFVAPVEAQKKPKSFERFRSKQEALTSMPKTLPPDPECQNGYLFLGSAKLHNAAYNNSSVRLHDINGGAQLQVTPTQLLFTALTGYLPGGGSATGELKIDNWLGEVPANTPPQSATVQGVATTANKTSAAITGKSAGATPPVVPSVVPAHAYLTVKVDRIPLRTIMDVTAPKDYGDLGFDTAFSGPLKAEWGGPATAIGNTVQVDADLRLGPTGVKRRGALSEIPVTGQMLGHYDGKTETVKLPRVLLNTPQSTLTANGVLGVSDGDRLTQMNVDLALRNLGEYDQLLRTFGLTGNGKKGAAAIPVALHGSAQFHGTATGELAKLDVKGHLEAANLEVLLAEILTPAPPPAAAHAAPNKNLITATLSTPPPPPPAAAASTPTDVHIDSLVADAEYTPQGLAVGSSTITQGSAVLHISGAFKPRMVYVHRKPTYVWDDGTSVNAKVQLANGKAEDVLAIAGRQKSIPVTGTANVNGQIAGTFGNLDGSGTIGLANGVAYGEPYETVNVNLAVTGKDVEASQVSVRLHGMTIAGNGGYDLGNKHLHGHIQGNNLQLSKFTTMQTAKVDVDGLVNLVADANGTIEEPNLKADIKVANLVADGQQLGSATLDANSRGKLVFYNLRSVLLGAQVVADGQTELTGNYQTTAKMTISGFNLAKALAAFSPNGVQASSDIAGTIEISGPAKTPMGLSGRAQFSAFSLTSQGLTFKAAQPLTFGLRNGVATLDQVHLTGPDTDLRASGTAQVFGAIDPKTRQLDTKSGRLDIQTLGSVSMALVQTLDPQLIAGGKVVFAVGATGTLGDPALTGKVQIQNVNVAMEGIPNGLSNMNGTLVFNQNRLNVDTLTATTGGGQLKVGGFLTYRNVIYADLTATGDAVRVRLYGLSATSNTSLRLQGGTSGALLSGTVLLTRFGVGADVDFAAFASSGSVQAPPDPSAASNKIRLDVRINSSPQLDFQNSYAKLAGNVALTVRGTVAEPSILGRVQITDGSATFAGTKYQLQRGDVYFTNPVRIDPTVDIDATARVETYDVTVGLHGTATNLQPTYRSEPPLTEADIFALLALGRTQEEAQIYQEQQVAAGTDPTTSALLGGALNATVSSRVSKLFGGGSVKIDPAFIGTLGNSTARITVQQQLSRQITLTYATNVNSSAQQLIAVQYQFNPNLSVVATRDETGVFSIVYKIRKRYK